MANHSEYSQWSTVTIEMDNPMDEWGKISGRMNRSRDRDMLSLRRWNYLVAQVTGEQLDDVDIRTSDNNRARMLGRQHGESGKRFLVIDVAEEGDVARGVLYKVAGQDKAEEIERVGALDTTEAFKKSPEEVVNFFEEHHDFQGFIEA